MRPIVAVDIDGTLGDYHTHLIDFAIRYLDRPPIGRSYSGIGHFRDWFCVAFQTDLSTFRQIKLAYRQGAQKRTMRAYHSMTDLVRWLHQGGVEIWLTTTRPYLRLDGIDPDTREWLRRNGVPYDGLLYDEDKYRVLAERVEKERVVAVIDDLYEQYDAAEAVFGPDVPVMHRTEWNSSVDRPVMINGGSEGRWLIGDRLLEWWHEAAQVGGRQGLAAGSIGQRQ